MSRNPTVRSFHPDDKLVQLLRDAGVDEPIVQNAVESGYYMRSWSDHRGGSYETVSDLLYGNKQSSSSFEFEAFVRYLLGDNQFETAPPFVELTVRNMGDIEAALAEPRRQHYISEGSLTFRGQWKEYRLRRPVPNPFWRATDGTELSVMPGAFRQAGPEYRLSIDPSEGISWEGLLHELEPNSPDVYADSHFAYDPMRVEQHYASPTAGLDLTFNIDTALFFALHRFTMAGGIATFDRVAHGANTGVIYCFRFGSPTVKKSDYYVRTFDLFKTYRPERILRQQCGLPLIGDFERNIAITEIDCILRLHPEFDCKSTLPSEYIFPSVNEDAFYRKLLELKHEHPRQLNQVVEYAWARS
jgi:hypothetical protein